MNKAMLCTLKRDEEEKKILIIKNKIDTKAHNLEVDYQFQDTEADVQQLINSQVGQKLKPDFLETEQEGWKLSSKKMFISNFNYAYDLSGLKEFIDSLVEFKLNEQEIDLEIIEMLKDDIFAAADFWENENIDQDLTAELILKYWDLEPVPSYPQNDYYKKLMQFADGQIELIDEEIADIWFKIPPAVRAEIKKVIEAGKISYKNYLVYLQTRDNYILNDLLLNFIQETESESQASVNSLFEKFHYQLIDELTKYALEKDRKIDLKPVIPHADSQRKELELKPDLKMTDFSLIEIFNQYSIEIDFEGLKLFSNENIKSLADYLKSLALHLDYLNQMRGELKCDSCGRMMEYNLDYSQETAVYKVESAYCNHSDCENFKKEIKF
ncbi:MAG: hypothetical protein ACOCQZ_01320 [Halanaerobium sp.]